jgi:rhodanese-related sulfurtransferase
MPSLNSISVEKLARLIGTPGCPALIDVRLDEDFAAAPRLLPGSLRRDHAAVGEWSAQLSGRPAIVLCQAGGKLSEGTAAWLRHLGVEAEVLEGGFAAWAAAGHALIPEVRIPTRNSQGSTVWVTRARPKIDRIACPWLIRRFVDPGAVFLFVAAQEVEAVAERFAATPFDVEDVLFSHRGELCTFDVMIEEFGLATPPLLRLATIVRAADTARLDLAPEAPGLLAVSLGLSRLHADDLAQIDAGIRIYDAFYRWARDATGETHNWPSTRVQA